MLITEGKLFFDFDIRPNVPDDVLKACRKAVERAIDNKDPWCYGNNVRNTWVQLYDVPEDHKKMHDYLNRKLEPLDYLTVEPDPPSPITYCYSGDSRICYHPHTVLLNGNPWMIEEQDVKMTICLVLTYNTKCFPIPMSSSAAEGAA